MQEHNKPFVLLFTRNGSTHNGTAVEEEAGVHDRDV